jgi:ubiquitin
MAEVLTKCKDCGNIQKGAAPPCDRCQGMRLEMFKK